MLHSLYCADRESMEVKIMYLCFLLLAYKVKFLICLRLMKYNNVAANLKLLLVDYSLDE